MNSQSYWKQFKVVIIAGALACVVTGAIVTSVIFLAVS